MVERRSAVWTFETVTGADPAVRLNELMEQGCTVEIITVLPTAPGRDAGGVLIRYSEPEPPRPA